MPKNRRLSTNKTINVFTLPKILRHFISFSIIITFLLCSQHTLSKTISESSFYIKSELLSESNIFEDSSNTGTVGNQFWGGFTHNYHSGNQRLQLNLLSNLIHYHHYRSEDKSVNLLTIQYSYLFSKGFALEMSGEVFNKQWYQAANGYSNQLIDMGLKYSFHSTSICFGGNYRYNRFPSFSQFTSDYRGYFLRIEHKPKPRATSSVKITRYSIRYSDRAFTSLDSSNAGKSVLQKDNLLLIQAGFEKHHKPIIGMYFRYLANASNCPEASFQAAAWRFMISEKIIGFYTQMIIDIQLKEYTNNLDRLRILANPDPEQNIQNQLLFGWERPFNNHFSLQGKLAYIRNETAYSDRFYDKWFGSMGIVYRL